MKPRHALLAIFTVAMFLAVSLVPLIPGNNSSATDFSGYTSISTPQELAKIGNDPAYPLDGKYYLANDIVFNGIDTNRGVDIDLSAVVYGSNITVVVSSKAGSVTSLYAWLGTSSVSSNGSKATLTNIPKGVCTLTVGGMVGSEPFVYSIEIDTSTNGEKADVTFNSNGNFDPIGRRVIAPEEATDWVMEGASFVLSFTGIFNGNGHVISGMNVAVFKKDVNCHAGLFGYAGEGAVISNVGLVNGSTVAAAAFREASEECVSAGGIVGGTPSEITLYNCYNTGSVTVAGIGFGAEEGATLNAGGILGHVHKELEAITITGCYNTGTVTANASSFRSETYAGGIAGQARSHLIRECYNTGQVTAFAQSSSGIVGAAVGGIIGKAGGTVADCYNTGPITASTVSGNNVGGAIAGGICGIAPATVINCYSIGPVASWDPSTLQKCNISSGIVGSAWNTIGTSITNCYFLENNLTEDGITVKDIICDRGWVMIDGNEDGKPRPGMQGSGAKTSEQMKPTINNALNGRSIYFTMPTKTDERTVAGWDFEEVWTIDEDVNDGYPTLIPLPMDEVVEEPGSDIVLIAACVIVLAAVACAGMFFVLRRKP